MRKITFETAGLAAAVGKAARVAPTKGMAFDKVAGIMIEIDPSKTDHRAVTIRATNLEVDYLEWIQPLDIETTGGSWEWRLPSALLAGFCAALPIGSGSKITLSQDNEGERIVMKCGKTTARIAPITGGAFKSWEPFDPNDLKPVTGLATRIGMVGWATDPMQVPFSGIHLDGDAIYATDRYKMVRVPCSIPLDKPVTVPLDTLTPILKQVEDVRLGVDARSLMLMPDDYTQLRTVIYDADYPPMARVLNSQVYNRHVVLPRHDFREAVRRMLSLVGRGERYPTIEVLIHDGHIDLEMEVPEVGNMTDSIEVETIRVDHPEIDHDPDVTLIKFTPTYLTESLDQTKADKVWMSFRTDEVNKPVRVSDHEPDSVERGFDSWLMPKRPGMPEPKKDDDADD